MTEGITFSRSESSDNYMAKPFELLSFCKHYWLVLLTLFCTALAMIQSSLSFINMGNKADYVMLPAELFLRHVRGFVALFVLFAAASRVRLLLESKESPHKRKVWFFYIFTSVLMLVISIPMAYLIIPGKPADLKTQYFVPFEPEGYTPGNNFVRFFRGLAVHDLPGNMLTTRIENYNEFGNPRFRDGLGDGYNAPGFVVYGLLIAFSLYSLGGSVKVLQESVQKVHKCLLGVYWILVCYSPIAFYFSGIVTYDKLSADGTLSYVFNRYVYLVLAVIAVSLIRVLVILPIIHFVRCGSFGFDVYKRILHLLPTAFTGGSSVLMIEKTRYYLKRHDFDEHVLDSTLEFCTLADGEGIASGFCVCAVFVLKLFGNTFDWSVLFKMFVTGLLLSLVIAEYIQGYLFGIIFFLNTSYITPPAIIILLIVDWLYDRFRITANVVSDALALDYAEKLIKKECDMPL